MDSAAATPASPGASRGVRGPDGALAPQAFPPLAVPRYLDAHYWWAYVHPNAVRFFERQWLANLILWGNYARLRDAALNELGHRLPGHTVQIACAYGDMTPHLCDRVAAGGGTLDIIDVLPVQLDNLRRKLAPDAPARLIAMDSASLQIPDASYDRAVLFFLLHEQPEAHRRDTLAEALRVVKPGGRLVIIDYARPHWWNPLRWLFGPLLAVMEPFALDLWRDDITAWMPSRPHARIERETLFGGLYQKLVLTC